MAPTVIIADDHPLFCEALEMAVQRVRPDARIVRTTTLKETLEAIASQHPSTVFLDLMMPDSRGFAGLLSIRQLRPELPVVVVSASDDPSVTARARAFGAHGFIPKSAPLATIREAMGAAMAGKPIWPDGSGAEGAPLNGNSEAVQRLATLTPAQMRVLMGLSEGLLNKQIAYEMNISEATVKAHVTAVFRKLHVVNRTQAVLAAKALDIIQPEIDLSGAR